MLRRYNRKHTKLKPGPAEESEQPLTWTELERVINEPKNNKAAGEDDIPYQIIKNLCPRAKELPLHLYNRSLDRSGSGREWPFEWQPSLIPPRTLYDQTNSEVSSTSY